MNDRDARPRTCVRSGARLARLARLGTAVVCLAILIGSCTSADVGDTADADGDDASTQTTSVADSDPEEPTPTSDRSAEALATASAFWAAIAAGDRQAAASLVDPAALDAEGESEAGTVLDVGRAWTLEGQFDWYEAVGWQWTAGECVMDDQGLVRCTATASNAWSDTLGVDPITGEFRVEVSDEGITKVADWMGSFRSPYSRDVYVPFSSWVRQHHPEDAAAMWNYSEDVDAEGLALFEVNTQRFVDAHEDG